MYKKTISTLVALLFAAFFSIAGAQTVYYLNEGFDETHGSSLPSGWNNSDYTLGSSTSSSSVYLWKTVALSAAESHDGNAGRCAYLDANNYYVTAARLKTPRIALSQVRETKLSFKLKNGSEAPSTGNLNVYVSTDGGQTYTSNLIAGNISAGASWVQYEYSLSGFKGQNVVVVFEGNAGASSSMVYYLDDVQLKNVPLCQAPDYVYLSNLNSNSVTVNWTLNQGNLVVPDKFSLQLLDGNGNVVLTDDNIAGSAQSYNLTNLTSKSQYTVQVSGNCDAGSYAGYSDWTTLTFTTLDYARNLPYSEDFDALTALPREMYSHNASLNASASYSYGGYGKSLKLITSATDYAYVLLPLLNAHANEVEVDLQIRRFISGVTMGYKIGYVTDPSDVVSTFTPIVMDSLTVGADWVNVRFNTALLGDTTSPLLIAIFADNGNSSSIFVDNVEVHYIPTCTRPENVTVSNVTAHSATVDWNMSNATSYTIKATDVATGSVMDFAATQAPYTITGLDANVTYSIKVRGFCSASDSSSASLPQTITTLCDVAASPIFVEDFEETASGETPDCWSMDWIVKSGASGTVPFTTSTAFKHSGTKSMTLRNQGDGSISWLSTFAVPFDQAGKYDVSIWVYRQSTPDYPDEGISVWLTATPGDTTNGTKIGNIHRHFLSTPAESGAGWANYLLNVPVQGTYHIMIVGYSENGSATYFDDVEVKLAPTCHKVTDIVQKTVGYNDCTIGWTKGSDDESQWIVDYRVLSGNEQVAAGTAVVNDSTYTFTGLNPATLYSVEGTVRAICSVGDTSDAVSFEFRQFQTLCGPIANLPYSTSFEQGEDDGTTSHQMTKCWTRLNDATGTTNFYPYNNTSTTYSRTGTRTLYFYAATTASMASNQIAVLPQIDVNAHPINTLRVRFWLRKQSTSTSYADAPIEIGVMDSLQGVASFTPVDTVVADQTTYVQHKVHLTNYTGQGSYIAFRLQRQSKASYAYIDDVTIDLIPTCPDLEGSATLSNVTTSSIDVTIIDATATTGWDYACGLHGMSVDAMPVVTVTGLTTVIDSLAADTKYDLYVRRHCESSNGAWTDVITFSTTRTPAQAPYVCGFENTTENSMWQFANGTGFNKFIVGAERDAVKSGLQSLYVSNNGSGYDYTLNSASLSYAYRTIHFDQNQYIVSFDWKCEGGEANDFGRVALVPASENIEGGTGKSYSEVVWPTGTIELNPAGMTALMTTSGWQEFLTTVDMTACAGNYNLVAMWNNNATSGLQTPLAIDNIEVKVVTCLEPTSTFVSVGSDTANVTCQHGTASQWQIIVDDEQFDRKNLPASPLYTSVSTTNTIHIPGLSNNTEYYYSVRSICGAGDTSLWTVPETFRTQCLALSVPYSESFEEVYSTECWSKLGSDATSMLERSKSARYDGVASMRVENAIAVSPKFNVTSLSGYVLSGWAYSPVGNSSFDLGVMNDPNDISDLETIATISMPEKGVWRQFTVYLSMLGTPEYSEHANAQYIAFASSQSKFFFDKLSLKPASACGQPSDVAISNITSSSFDISFTDHASATSWVVYTDTTAHVVTTNPATISGLSPATDYYVSVAANCTASGVSDETPYGTISTLCGDLSLPWSCGFEQSEGFVYSGTGSSAYHEGDLEAACWKTLNVKANNAASPVYYAMTTASHVHSGTQSLATYFTSAATKTVMYLILPEFADSTNNVEVSFWYKNTGTTSSYSQFKLGYMTDVNDETSFVLIEALPKIKTWTSYQKQTSTCAGMPGNARLVIAVDRDGSNGGSAYIDDIAVKALADCPDPSAAVIGDITATTATASITRAGQTTIQYVYGEKGFDHSTVAPTAMPACDSVTLTNLEANTEYDFYVRSVCGTDSASSWIRTRFTTLCAPFVVTVSSPYYDSFEDQPTTSQMGICYNTTGYYSASYRIRGYVNTGTYTYSHTGDVCLYSTNSKTNQPNGQVIYRELYLEQGKTYRASIFARATTNSSVVSVAYGAVADFDSMTLVSTDILNNCASTKVTEGGTSHYYFSDCWTELGGLVKVPTTGVYNIAVKTQCGTSTTATILLDDLTVEELAGCLPAIVTIDSIGENMVTVSFDDTVATHNYEYQVVSGSTVTVSPTAVPSNPFTIVGLDHSSDYTVSVRRVCDDGNTSTWTDVNLQTSCGTVQAFPLTEGFEGNEMPPRCWSQISYGATTQAVWTSSTGQPHTGTKAAYVMNKPAGSCAALITPELNLTGNGGYTVKFWMWRSAGEDNKVDEALHVRYSTQPITAENISAATEIGVVNRSYLCAPVVPATGWYEYSFTIPSSVTGTAYVAFDFHHQNGYPCIVDDISIYANASCPAPKASPTVVNSAMTTAQLAVDMESHQSAEVVWALSVSPAITVGSATVTDGSTTATGLTPTTQYIARYRFICAPGDTSDWSPAINFTTTTTDCFAPQNLRTVGLVTGHSASVTWGKAPQASVYEYLLSAGGNTIANGTSTEDTLSFDNLSASTEYTFMTRGYCTNGGVTDTSAWEAVSFTTTAPSFAIPFICGFEDAVQNVGWTMNNPTAGNGYLTIGTDLNAINTGQKALYATTDGTTYTSDNTLSGCDAEVILEMTAGNYYVSYDWKCQGRSQWVFGRVFLIPAATELTSFVRTGYIYQLPTGAIMADGGVMSEHSDWQRNSMVVQVPSDGLYKLVVVFIADGGGTQPPLSVDNIRVESVGCMPVSSATVTGLTANSAKITVTKDAANKAIEYGMSPTNTPDSVEIWTRSDNGLASDIVELSGLAENSTYYLYVRHICQDGTASPATLVPVYTPSAVGEIPFVCSFESDESVVSNWTFTSGAAANYFTTGNAISSDGSNALYITDDGVSYHYDNVSTSHSYAYIPIQFNEGMYDVYYDWLCKGEYQNDYARVFLAPASMPIPEDNTDISGMGPVTLPSGCISLDEYWRMNNRDSWLFDRHIELSITSANVYNLVVYWRNNAEDGEQPPFAIDNIRISEITCVRPAESSITVDSASTDFVRFATTDTASTMRYVISRDDTFADTLAQGTKAAGDSTFTVTGLSASRWYYARLFNVCSADDQSAATEIKFRTACGPMTEYPFVEGFESITATDLYNEIDLSDNCWLVGSNATAARTYLEEDLNNVNQGVKALKVSNGTVTGSYTTLALPMVDSLNGKNLTLSYNCSGSTPGYALLEIGYLTNANDLSTFTSLVTTTASEGYYSEASYDYNGLPANARPALKVNGIYDLYIDDIHLNNTVGGSVVYDTICYNTPYSGHGVSFNAGRLLPGDTTITNLIRSTVLNTPDSMVTLNIHVCQENVVSQYDTICSGEPYNVGQWSIANPTDRIYTQSFSSVAGCDSTVFLTLTVMPSRENVSDTICQGDSLNFHGQILRQSGTYVATIVSRFGCNDTITMNLLVADSLNVTNATICSGGSYVFEGVTYTQAGTYRVPGIGLGGCPMVKVLNLAVIPSDSTIVTSFCQGGDVFVVDTLIKTAGNYTLVRYAPQGCSTTYHITVTETPAVPTEYYDYVCEGHTYTGYGISGLVVTADTVVSLSSKTAAGCDSLTNVHIKFQPSQRTEFSATIKSGEHYTWNDNTYSVAGDYQQTLVDTMGCDSIVTLHLSVTSGVADVNDIKLEIVPNPVDGGTATFVYGNLTDVKSVEVLNSFGQVVDTFVPESYPIEVKAISAAGIYYVRVITEDEKVAVEKLIVK